MSDLESNYDYGKLAKKRMLWAIKPILGVIIVVWIFHPATATSKEVATMELKGFLAGAIYGLVIYRESIKKFWMSQKIKTTDIKNRVPDEYYMGHIEKVLRSKDEREI
tara:strand:+ start:1630 stop:1953 length:324 start_codon:yes stop_codon:yes gene_type:complete